MSHHAYLATGDVDTGITRAKAFAETLGISEGNEDLVVLRYGLFSVKDARDLATLASRTGATGARVIIVAATRIFHEAQNAALKLFEEPIPGTVLILIVPSEGDIIATLRSRLQPLPVPDTASTARAASSVVDEFLAARKEARAKLVAKLLDRTKSDKDEEKQAARADALSLIEGLARAAYPKRDDASVRAFLADLDRFIPILHERSAPLKLIFEHVLLTIPSKVESS